MRCDMCGGRGKIHNPSCPDAPEPETEAERDARESEDARREDYDDDARHVLHAMEYDGAEDA